MKLLVIDCNKGIPINGGFKHVALNCLTVNGNKITDKIMEVIFTGILSEDFIYDFRCDPENFIEGLDES